MITRLVLTPSPKQGESAGGYLLRVAEQNHFANFSVLEEHFPIKFSEAARIGNIGLYKNLLAPEGIQQLLKNIPAAPLARVWLQSINTRWRVCPDCLREEGFRKVEWDMPLSHSCAIHSARLIRACDQCGRTLQRVGFRLFQCTCGRDLRKIPTERMPDWIVRFHQVFTPWRRKPNCDFFSQDIERKEMMATKIALALFFICQDRPIVARIKGALGVHSMEPRVWPFLEQIIDDWPEQINGRLGTCLHKTPLSARTILKPLMMSPDAPPFAKHLSEILDAYNRRTIVKKPFVSALAPAKDLIGLTKLCRIMGIDASVAYRLFDNGIFAQPACTRLSSGRICKWVSIRELFGWQSYLRETLSEEEAATFMHAQHNHIYTLARCSYVTATSYLRQRRYRRYRPRDLDELLLRLAKIALPAVPSMLDLVPLTAIFLTKEKYRVNKKLSRLMDAIRTKKIALFQLGKPQLKLANFAVSYCGAESAVRLNVSRRIMEKGRIKKVRPTC